MNKLYKNPGFYWAWRRGIVLLALLLFAGCSQLTDAPPEDPNNSQEQSGQESPSGKTEDGDKSQGEGVIPGDTPATEKPAGEETPPGDTPATEEPIGEETPPGDTPATEEPIGEETPPGDTPATEEPAGEETPAEETPAGEEPPEEETLPLAITAFSIGGIEGIIDEEPSIKTITLTLPAGTELGSLVPTITLSNPAAEILPASGEAQDFSQPVDYTLSLGDVKIAYRTRVDLALAEAREGRSIGSFSINGVPGVIDEEKKAITLTLPFGTDLKALTPEFILSDGATASPASGAAQNFANSMLIPKKYTVTAENGMKAEYKVTVQTAAQNSFILALTRELKFSAASVSIPRTAKTASVSLPSGYERYQWSMDGKPVGTDGRTITLKGEDYSIGSHYLGATAYLNEIPFYGELIVTITP